MTASRYVSLLLAVAIAIPVAPAQAPARAEHSAHARARRDVDHRQQPLPFSAYNDHPKLAILLVIDQFRGDYLSRWRSDFKGRGFNLFLDHGAYFPDCYYNYANNETAPGHAAIATGAYTDGNGISADAWWDLARNQYRMVSSVEDEHYELVGLPWPGAPPPAPAVPGTSSSATPATASQSGATPATPGASPSGAAPATPNSSQPAPASKDPAKYVTGASPLNLRASTLGDELRLATQGQAKVFGVSLKDRAAILSAGDAANGAFWIDPASGDFVTSSYYMKQLPDWAIAFNSSGAVAQAEQAANVSNLTNFYKQVGSTPAANDYELQFAEALIQGEQLGQRNVPDLLTISLSANDIMGHQYGPDSPQEQQMVDSLDTQLDGFFTWLDKNIPGGLGNVWIALTSDHGVAPLPATAAQYGLNAATIDMKKLVSELNYAMNMKFSPGEKIQYIMPHQILPYISLNEGQFMKDGINEQEAEKAVQQALPSAFQHLLRPVPAPPPSDSPVAGTGQPAIQPSMTRLPPRPRLFSSYTRTQLSTGALPLTPWGRLIANSYSPNGGWYLMVIPGPYQMSAVQGTSHFSPWSYDRHVPLAFWGAPFAPGVYLNQVQPVDIAPTFAALLGINAPSASVGHILTEAIKPAADITYPREIIIRRAAPARHEAHPAAHAAPAKTPAQKPASQNEETHPSAPAPTPAAPQVTGPQPKAGPPNQPVSHSKPATAQPGAPKATQPQ